MSTSPAWTPEIERELRPMYERVKRVIPPVEWPVHGPYIAAINALAAWGVCAASRRKSGMEAIICLVQSTGALLMSPADAIA